MSDDFDVGGFAGEEGAKPKLVEETIREMLSG